MCGTDAMNDIHRASRRSLIRGAFNPPCVRGEHYPTPCTWKLSMVIIEMRISCRKRARERYVVLVGVVRSCAHAMYAPCRLRRTAEPIRPSPTTTATS